MQLCDVLMIKPSLIWNSYVPPIVYLGCAVFNNVEMAQLPSSAVRETVCAAPLFDEWLRRDVENQSADALVLVLHLYDKLLSKSSPLLPESGNIQDFFKPSHLAKLVPCLKVRIREC